MLFIIVLIALAIGLGWVCKRAWMLGRLEVQAKQAMIELNRKVKP